LIGIEAHEAVEEECCSCQEDWPECHLREAINLDIVTFNHVVIEFDDEAVVNVMGKYSTDSRNQLSLNYLSRTEAMLSTLHLVVFVVSSLGILFGSNKIETFQTPPPHI
jgi:hypothetical protein